MTPEPREERELWERLRAAEIRLEEREKALQSRWRDHEMAVSKASRALEERLTLLNELRGGVLTRAEYEGKHEALHSELERNRQNIELLRGECATVGDHRRSESRLSALENWRANIMGRAVAVGIIGAIFVAGMAAIFTHVALK